VRNHPSPPRAESHSPNLRTTDMGSGPVCAMVWEGREVVKTGRMILGATNPLASQPGTIRGDYAIVSRLSFMHRGLVN